MVKFHGNLVLDYSSLSDYDLHTIRRIVQSCETTVTNSVSLMPLVSEMNVR
jgi:hypothetical protein